MVALRLLAEPTPSPLQTLREERTIPDVLRNVQVCEMSAGVCIEMHKHVIAN